MVTQSRVRAHFLQPPHNLEVVALILALYQETTALVNVVVSVRTLHRIEVVISDGWVEIRCCDV